MGICVTIFPSGKGKEGVTIVLMGEFAPIQHYFATKVIVHAIHLTKKIVQTQALKMIAKVSFAISQILA